MASLNHEYEKERQQIDDFKAAQEKARAQIAFNEMYGNKAQVACIASESTQVALTKEIALRSLHERQRHAARELERVTRAINILSLSSNAETMLELLSLKVL